VESGYALIRKQNLPNSVLLIPAVLLTREFTPEVGGWGR